MKFWALVAFGCKSHRQSSAIGKQYELGNPQQCKALIIFQTEVPFHPGEITLDIGARIDDQSFPLLEEERGRQFAFASSAQVVVDGWMGMQEVVDYFEHAPIEVGRIGIDHQNPEAIDDSRHQDHEPADLRVMHMGWRNQDENWQVSLATQDGMHFVAENGSFFGIFLPGRVRICRIPGW